MTPREKRRALSRRLARCTIIDYKPSFTVRAGVLRDAVGEVAKVLKAKHVWFYAVAGALHVRAEQRDRRGDKKVDIPIAALVPPEVAAAWLPFAVEIRRLHGLLKMTPREDPVTLTDEPPVRENGDGGLIGGYAWAKSWPGLAERLRAHPGTCLVVYSGHGSEVGHVQVVSGWETACGLVRALRSVGRDIGNAGVAWDEGGTAVLLLQGRPEGGIWQFWGPLDGEGPPQAKWLGREGGR